MDAITNPCLKLYADSADLLVKQAPDEYLP